MLQSSMLLAIIPLIPPAYLLATETRTHHPEAVYAVVQCVLLAIIGHFATRHLIHVVRQMTLKAGLSGKDINKKGTKEGEKDVPESLGIVSGTVYLVLIIMFQLFQSFDSPEKVGIYNAAFASICFMIFLGFADDVLDLRWRYKLFLPTIASLPLIIAYTGSTTIVVPKMLHAMLGYTLELGIVYKLYMCLLSVFCTNSINIFAGINGLEAGQSFVIACFVLVHNLLQLDEPEPTRSHHLFSAFLIIPFIAVTLGLLAHNWYPSSVFVGDTFCYFAGMTFAVAGILGHFSELLLLFFIPQLINFIYSIPQLVWLPCPRHRLPRYNMETRKLEGIPSNLNLVNLTLCITGPMSERNLCIVLLTFQFICCCLGLYLRQSVIDYFY
eukprot:TRINITY_DN12737_c0_g1::TRINITY_DN12737_c0_g1_i1::g.28682::m.28682 TRINITY_DN12737_c0_g1::TRINITY_DN12737_c0_g1_i1::g.28682  ORF type:complete len:405 (-),score=42.17,sp/P0CD61/GPT_DICDI/53.02/7e-123,Glycos_transf_4/PF00953.16/2.9e+03,Glycos_transf_4/PF00953.16/1.4e+04,Glycos_transf_4/PF00953.16/4e-35,Glycos_transf_4/PF00953.16/4.6e+03,Orai-1/PF07856.7/0.051 TRINITY_DN12737_c0_g1_i1:412-1560(-)